MTTGFHARYFAYELTRQHRAAGVSTGVFNACVNLNPHQVEAAVFALKNPLSSGALLADEVGLGKTIEAGLILCQLWAERRRRLLVICPASLRKQWSLELLDKFNLRNEVIDAQNRLSFDQPDRVVITSYEYASKREDELRATPFDLVVIDEAHKLRNVYKADAKRANAIKSALQGRRKVLLTATPLQNSLLEIYGLSTILSDEIFGDIDAFKARYTAANGDIDDLRSRLSHFYKRTLRNDVKEYVKYTARRPMTARFRPSDDEHKLYEEISQWLLREDSLALPKKGRQLIEMVIRKLLASSSPAVARTLERMSERLQRLRDGLPPPSMSELLDDEDLLSEFDENDEREQIETGNGSSSDAPAVDRKNLQREIEELTRFAQWARGISIDTKSRKLLDAIKDGFGAMHNVGAERKALIFTESRRTQDYLKNFLEANGFAGQIVLFNGSNSGPDVAPLIDRWIAENRSRGRVSGSRVVDARTALVEHFRDHASIMIATEAAAEGINLQFCSLVMNYDLPWNPQRIEQRIGRCHRYGQKFDVVVVNFLNERNRADERVQELLASKFKLFDGVFGASDDVLGSIDAGVDFEKRIHAILRTCRTAAEIDAAFDNLQQELKPQIEKGMEKAKQAMLDEFDVEVHERLKDLNESEQQNLSRIQRQFWQLTRFILSDRATFDDARYAFDLRTTPQREIAAGHYELISKEHENVVSNFLYRMTHPLGEWVLDEGKRCETPTSTLRFDVSGFGKKLTQIEQLKGRSGWLTLQLLVIDSFDKEEYLLFSGLTDEGRSLEQETCEKLFQCEAVVVGPTVPATDIGAKLHQATLVRKDGEIHRSLDANNRLFREECDRIERWAKDKEDAAELALKQTKKLIEVTRKKRDQATTVDEQLAIQIELTRLETQKKKQRRELDYVEDETAQKREWMIARLKKRMAHQTTATTLFTVRWEVV